MDEVSSQVKRALIFIFTLPIKIYQYGISPLLGANCRFSPTCSSYTAQAIKEWGPIRGTWLGIRRFGRCHPWGGHGYDPVPKRDGQKWF